MSQFDSFESLIRRGQRPFRVARNLIDAALAQSPPRLVLVKGARKIALTRNPGAGERGDCPWRITDFDERGPSGHREYKATDRRGIFSMDHEIAGAIRAGFRRERRAA